MWVYGYVEGVCGGGVVGGGNWGRAVGVVRVVRGVGGVVGVDPRGGGWEAVKWLMGVISHG